MIEFTRRQMLVSGTAVAALPIEQTVAFGTDGRDWIEVPAPIQDTKAIKLSGDQPNASPETWLRRRDASAAPWWIGNSGPLIVRNVSRASITPFLPEKNRATGAAMIVAPGGGTLVLGMEMQGYEIARWLNGRGIAAFVLKYRLIPTPRDVPSFLRMLRFPKPVYSDLIPPDQQERESAMTHADAVDAIRYVRTHADQWSLAKDRIGIIGFSAGAWTAVGTAFAENEANRPDLVAAIYGTMMGHPTPSGKASPLFMAAAADEVSGMNSSDHYNVYFETFRAWRRASFPAEIHMFADGGHGFGLDPAGSSSDQWTKLFEHWLRQMKFART